jgi:hypothetical protein
LMMRQSLSVPFSLYVEACFKDREQLLPIFSRSWSFGPFHLFLVTFKSIAHPIDFMPFFFCQPTP